MINKKKFGKKFFNLCGGNEYLINKNTYQLNQYIKKYLKNILLQNKTLNINNKKVILWYKKYDLYNNNLLNNINSDYNIINLIIDQINNVDHILIDPSLLLMLDFLHHEEINYSGFHSLSSAIYSPTKYQIDNLDITPQEKILLLSIYCTLLLYYFNPNILEEEYQIKLINSVYEEIEMLIGNFKHLIFYLSQGRPTRKDYYIKKNIINFLNRSKPFFNNSLINKDNENFILFLKKYDILIFDTY